MAALKYWVWLSALPGLTNLNKLQLLSAFTSPEDLFFATAEDAYGVEGLSREQAAWLDNKSMEETERILADCAREDIFIITMDDALYPARLRNIFDPPILLYGKGHMPLFDEEAAIAVVGTRDSTLYGEQCAEELGYELARQGAMVVSGMAKGIDAAGLRGALRAGGFTCAVLGCGVDIPYPAENRRLYEDVATTGVILSEYPPKTAPAGWHFPVRNRIISGLTLGTLVAEAPEKSGALITARDALEQGRDVFAVPGPIHGEKSAGCHQLIREGAALAASAWDVLMEYAPRYPHKLHRIFDTLPPLPEERTKAEPKKEKKPPEEVPPLPVLDLEKDNQGLTDDQIAVIKLLHREPMLTEEVAEATGLSIRRVLSALTVLELDGYVNKCGPQSFVTAVTVLNKGESI